MAGCAARCEGEDKLYTTFNLLDLRRRERSNDHRCTRGASRMIPRFRQVLPPPPHEVMKIRRVRVFGDSLPLDPASLERPELEACLELFTRLTRSTRSAESTPGFGGAGGAGGREGGEGGRVSGPRVSVYKGTPMSHATGARIRMHVYGLCVRAILINTLLTPRPEDINHKTMENGARGRSQQRDLSIPLSCTRRVRRGALHTHTHTHTQR